MSDCFSVINKANWMHCQERVLVIADVNERHEVSLFKDDEETLLWLAQYCPSAVVGFYEWDKIYEKNTKEF